MTLPVLRWPNVEKGVTGYLRPLVDGAVYTETSTDLPDRYLLVTRTGGAQEWISKDVDIELAAVDPTRAGMWDLVADVESAMWALAGSALPGGIFVDDVATRFGFAFDPPADPGVRRAIATFTLTVRPHRAQPHEEGETP